MSLVAQLTAGHPVSVNYMNSPHGFYNQKLCDKRWNESYAYITMVAFAALALVANLFVFPVAALSETLLMNTVFVALAYTLIEPAVTGWFAAAEKCERQAQKELAIREKLIELRAMDDPAISRILTDRGIQISQARISSRQNSQGFHHLLARALYYEEKSATLFRSSGTQRGLGNFPESTEAGYAASKAKAKAAFFAACFANDPHIFCTKFKDAFRWVEIPLTSRLVRLACQDPSAYDLFRQRDRYDPNRQQWAVTPKFTMTQVNQSTIGGLSHLLIPILRSRL